MRLATSFEGWMAQAVLYGFAATAIARLSPLWIFAVPAFLVGALAFFCLVASAIEMHAERYCYRLAKERRRRMIARLHVLKQRKQWLEEEIAQKAEGMGG